jgi:hypothetical protein
MGNSVTVDKAGEGLTAARIPSVLGVVTRDRLLFVSSPASNKEHS